MKRVLVCGDRRWTDAETITWQLASLAIQEPMTVIHGGAAGADMLAGQAAHEIGAPVEVFRADWATHGRAAGPIRNRAMLDTKPDLVLAFHDNLAASKGTRDCVMEARRRGITVRVVPSAYAALRQRAAAAPRSAPGEAR